MATVNRGVDWRRRVRPAVGSGDRGSRPLAYGDRVGATASGIKFSALTNINVDVLEAAIRDAIAQTGQN